MESKEILSVLDVIESDRHASISVVSGMIRFSIDGSTRPDIEPNTRIYIDSEDVDDLIDALRSAQNLVRSRDEAGE